MPHSGRVTRAVQRTSHVDAHTPLASSLHTQTHTAPQRGFVPRRLRPRHTARPDQDAPHLPSQQSHTLSPTCAVGMVAARKPALAHRNCRRRRDVTWRPQHAPRDTPAPPSTMPQAQPQGTQTQYTR
jgi:hypothetical protein